ncbi:unnamed protein product [Effrenium voratum]|uniref:Uncharacterized protein n=1 Tax=Effrenium voratum TaxID=2562239 RepID=A0AA36HNY0_9DINO|nr:unnamed protein product [Effrenium voratum]
MPRVLVLLVVPEPKGGLPRCQARPSPKYFGDGDKAKYATCAFDVWGAIDSLGFASLGINAASKECVHQDTDESKTVCTAAVSGVHACFADVASFLASAASDCAEHLNNPAYCAADSSGLVSALANIAVAGAGMHAVCDKSKGRVSILDEIGLVDNRRLQDNSTLRGREFLQLPGSPAARQEADAELIAKIKHHRANSDARKAEIAECFFDAHFSGQLLGRAGLAINAAAQDCTDFNFKINGAGGQKVCAVDLGGALGS